MTELDDSYRPYRPKRRTRATVAKERGLQPLADVLYAQEPNGEDPYVYPAAYDEVLSVGAVGLNGTVRSTSQKNDKVLVTAPGEGIAVLDLSRNDRCKLAEGTSYASPLAAAMAVAAKQHDSHGDECQLPA